MPDYIITKLRGGLALAFWRDGKRKRYALGTSEKSEAERRAPSLYAELTRPQGKSVNELWQAYTTDMAGRAVVATMTHTWKALRDRFGPMPGDEIATADCRSHTAERRKTGIKDGTIHTELGHLRMVLLWAEKQRLIVKASEIERPPKPASKEHHLTRAQVKALLKAAGLPHVGVFTVLAVGTGARKEAILGLTWDRCDFDAGMIDLRDPTINRPHKGRAIVPMNRMVRAALLKAKVGALTPYVVEWSSNRVASIKKGLATAGERAGIGHVHHHLLRHTSAVHLAERGVPMEEIAQYLGHRDVAVTRRVYARYSPNYLRKAAKVLEYDDLSNVTKG